MVVTCDDCDEEYDDLYRLTYCPHERFEMSNHVYGTLPDGSYGLKGIATTIEELRRLTNDG